MPPHPLAKTVLVPAWAILLAVVLGAGGLLVAVGIGYGVGRGVSAGGGAVNASGRGSARSMLYDPLDRKAIAAKVLGRSTREITEMFGPPDYTVDHETQGLMWVYRTNRSADEKKFHGGDVTLYIRNDRVAKCD